jgi:hypothetical protein
MICIGNINNSGRVVLFGRDYPICNGIYENFLAEQDLMENYLNHRYCMIEFFSAFDIKYDICRAQGLDNSASLSGPKDPTKSDTGRYTFDNIDILISNGCLYVFIVGFNEIIINSIDEFIDRFPGIYKYKKEFMIKTAEL